MATAEELRKALSSHMKTDIKMGDDDQYVSGYWSTGILPFDVTLGGGWLKGRMGYITGESQTLKSLVGIKTIASVQKQGGTAALIDTEHAYDPQRGADVGVDNNRLILIQPDIAEEAIDQMEFLIRNDIDLIVFDSIAAMLPRTEQKIQLSGKDNVQPARIAALMSIALRKLTAANTKSTVLWITQKRATMATMPFAAKTANTGGKAIEFYASQIIEIKKTNKISVDFSYWNGEKEEVGKQLVGQGFRLDLTKSRNRQPFVVSNFIYDYTSGDIDLINYLIGETMAEGLITKSGSWWVFLMTNTDGEVLNEYKAQGKDQFRKLIQETPELFNYMLTFVTNNYGLDAKDYGLVEQVS